MNEWEEYYRNHKVYARWMQVGAQRELLLAHAAGGQAWGDDITIIESLTQELIKIRQELLQVAKEWCAPIQQARKENEEREEVDAKQQSDITDNN